MERNKPAISVIIPVYNVEKYLDKCIKSVIAQTFSSLEILLIDDGSTDNSGAMCDSYALNDARIRVIHKQNGGLSDARNRGIEEASGHYLSFIDSDDYIEPDMMETLYNNIVKECAEVSMCGIYGVYADRIQRVWPEDEYHVLSGAQAAAMALEGTKVSVNAVNKLYKREVFDKLRFPVGKLSEDAFIMIKLLAGVEKAVLDTRPKYFYVHRGDSITTSHYRAKDMNVIEAYSENLDFVMTYYPEFREQAEFRFFWSHFYVLDKMLNTDSYVKDENFKNIVSVLRKNYFKILGNKYTGRKRKIAMTGLMLSSGLYKCIISAHYRRKRRLVD